VYVCVIVQFITDKREPGALLALRIDLK